MPSLAIKHITLFESLINDSSQERVILGIHLLLREIVKGNKNLIARSAIPLLCRPILRNTPEMVAA